jgi:hypothetical protein
MSRYSRNDIAQWLKGAFAVNRKNGYELQFDCPVCDHPSCYFNVDKQIGFCHRVTCRTTFTLDSMIDHIGYPPELAGYSPLDSMVKSQTSSPVELPRSAKQIERDDPAVEALATRGVEWKHIQQFQIHQDDKRLYVPVYEGGTLCQYNSRRIDTRKAPKDWFKAGENPYRYASGHPITHYFLGWEECRMWDRIVLVENTFVSMWLRDLKATATFGSHLSDVHMDKLLHSKVKHVTFLWDGGTGYATEKAARKLKMLGIPSKVIALPGKKQPDDYTKADIQEMING